MKQDQQETVDAAVSTGGCQGGGSPDRRAPAAARHALHRPGEQQRHGGAQAVPRRQLKRVARRLLRAAGLCPVQLVTEPGVGTGQQACGSKVVSQQEDWLNGVPLRQAGELWGQGRGLMAGWEGTTEGAACWRRGGRGAAWRAALGESSSRQSQCAMQQRDSALVRCTEAFTGEGGGGGGNLNEPKARQPLQPRIC